MKRASELVNMANLTEISQRLNESMPQCELNPLETEMLKRLWIILIDTYTTKFKNPEAPTEVWARHLKGLSPEQVKQGIELLPADWPPTPIEFRALCLQSKNIDGLSPGWRKDYRKRDAMRLENITARDAQALRNKDHAKELLRELRGDRRV